MFQSYGVFVTTEQNVVRYGHWTRMRRNKPGVEAEGRTDYQRHESMLVHVQRRFLYRMRTNCLNAGEERMPRLRQLTPREFLRFAIVPVNTVY